jgi:O-acetylhomoserine/O-acetylserine sulfhydrylase-like pyridoxal-dependent enzyme
VHGGEPRLNLASALTAPIVQTATYAFRDSQEIADHFEGRV